MDFNQLVFKHSWRPYQKRVLDSVDAHLDDSKLHIVAAPGAGKTTLGIEIFKRLAKKALILSPTRIIRDQWIGRLTDFVACDDPFQLSWTSNRLDAPADFTSITYQALHAKMANVDEIDLEDEVRCPNTSEIDRFITHLQDANINVLILDEAHHLRQEWWKAMMAVCDALPDIVLVSLTATPPYDSKGHEWAKYEQLCGPIDEEISVPELVKAHTLCAHQDYIWAVDATASEKVKIREFDSRVSQLCNGLLENPTFLSICENHPWLVEPQAYAKEVVNDPHLLIALLAFLNYGKHSLPKQALNLLDLTVQDIPHLTRHWWQKIIEAMLFTQSFNLSDSEQQFVDDLKKQLRASELLHKRELRLEHSKQLERSLSLSKAKIQGCLDIHHIELKQRKMSLRQVILTDFIRDEALTNETQIGESNLGSWPIFEKLVSASAIKHDIALLTGRLTIVHESKLATQCMQAHLDGLSTSPVAFLPGYVELNGPLNSLTHVLTQLLCEGEIKTLIGTRALLGEGWDAPVVNSLILASSVGSFMLTNQMRGRAIRIDKNAPQKVSSIWHLVAIDRKSYFGLMDYENLKKRFYTFVGLAANTAAIESGFERLDTRLSACVKHNESVRLAVYANNKQMLARFRHIDKLAKQWHQALVVDKTGRSLPSVETPKLTSFKVFHFKHTFKYLLFELMLGGMTVSSISLSLMKSMHSWQAILWCAALGFGCLFVKHFAKTVKALRVALLHLPIDGSLKQIGRAVLESLAHTGKLTTPLRQLNVKTTEVFDGSLVIALTGGTFYESSMFADNVAEVLAPIDNPRYLVVREGDFMGIVRKDYHAVPMCLAVKKEFAEIFVTAWSKHVGSADLIYTRTAKGKETLLKAKMRAFSSTFAKHLRRVDKWQ